PDDGSRPPRPRGGEPGEAKPAADRHDVSLRTGSNRGSAWLPTNRKSAARRRRELQIPGVLHRWPCSSRRRPSRKVNSGGREWTWVTDWTARKGDRTPQNRADVA